MILKAFLYLMEISIKASVIVLLVFALKWTIGRKMSAGWHYLLWFMVILALLIPMIPMNELNAFKQAVPLPDIDIQNYSYEKLYIASAHQQSSEKSSQLSSQESYQPSNELSIEPNNKESSQQSSQQNYFNQKKSIKSARSFNKYMIFLCIIWFSGLIINMANRYVFHVYFAKKMKLSSYVSLNVLEQIQECANLIGLKRIPEVYSTDAVTVPAAYRALRPRILIPIGFEDQVDPEEMQLILMHELLHIIRWDISVNVLVTMLQVLHWFNPFLICAFNHMRSDREMACDEMVLKLSHKDKQYQYGSLIIKLLRFGEKNYPINMAGMSANKKNMKRRIYMITKFGNKGKYARYFAALTLLIASIVTISFAINNRSQATETEVVETEIVEIETVETDSTQREYSGIQIHPGQIIVDDIDLPFVEDPDVLGEWAYVDFVRVIENFNPDIESFIEPSVMTKLIFLENGELKFNDDTDRPWFKWTKGVVTHSGDNTASHYTFQEIDGDTYMFIEHKSGDYTMRGMDLQYNVLKKVN